MEPFLHGPPEEDIVHLLAINDGRLLEWIEWTEDSLGGVETPLTALLYRMLQQEAATKESYIRFVNLNQRTLVGGITPDRTRIDTDFLRRLIDQLFGGVNAREIWAPCLSCLAQDRCEAFQTSRILGPDTLPSLAPPEVRARAHERLYQALQAVHLRGEAHITMRELRRPGLYSIWHPSLQ